MSVIAQTVDMMRLTRSIHVNIVYPYVPYKSHPHISHNDARQHHTVFAYQKDAYTRLQTVD